MVDGTVRISRIYTHTQLGRRLGASITSRPRRTRGDRSPRGRWIGESVSFPPPPPPLSLSHADRCGAFVGQSEDRLRHRIYGDGDAFLSASKSSVRLLYGHDICSCALAATACIGSILFGRIPQPLCIGSILFGSVFFRYCKLQRAQSYEAW